MFWQAGVQVGVLVQLRSKPEWRSRTESLFQAAFCSQSHSASSPGRRHAGKQKMMIKKKKED